METVSSQYELSSSWNPSTGNLKDFIIVQPSELTGQSDGDEVSSANEHSISEENYVKFERREDADASLPFTLSLSFENPRCRVTKLSVASEARIIELYGKHGEYLSTHVCDLLHEDDEYGQFHHSQPDVGCSQEITVKFICRNSSLWVFGIKIFYSIEPPSETPSRFNLRIIEDILRGSNRPLSEKAEKAMKFFENYAKTVGSTRQPAEFEQACGKAVNESTSSHRKDDQEDGESVRELKNYVDVCVGEVERRVTENVNERLNQMEAKQDEKLNEIIQMLQSKS